MPILRDKSRLSHTDSGFSLIEVIIALLIMSMLTGIVGINVRKAVQSSRLDAAKDAVEQIVRTTRAQSTFIGGFVPFDEARRGHPHQRDGQTIFFDPQAGSGADGICPESRGILMLDNQEIQFVVSHYSCVVSFFE